MVVDGSLPDLIVYFKDAEVKEVNVAPKWNLYLGNREIYGDSNYQNLVGYINDTNYVYTDISENYTGNMIFLNNSGIKIPFIRYGSSNLLNNDKFLGTYIEQIFSNPGGFMVTIFDEPFDFTHKNPGKILIYFNK